jgi:hypothetical protein
MDPMVVVSASIRLRMSDLEAAMSGLDANKGSGNGGLVPLLNFAPCQWVEITSFVHF